MAWHPKLNWAMHFTHCSRLYMFTIREDLNTKMSTMRYRAHILTPQIDCPFFLKIYPHLVAKLDWFWLVDTNFCILFQNKTSFCFQHLVKILLQLPNKIWHLAYKSLQKLLLCEYAIYILNIPNCMWL